MIENQNENEEFTTSINLILKLTTCAKQRQSSEANLT